jgi:hypothetical protein
MRTTEVSQVERMRRTWGVGSEGRRWWRGGIAKVANRDEMGKMFRWPRLDEIYPCENCRDWKGIDMGRIPTEFSGLYLGQPMGVTIQSLAMA